MDGQQVQQGTFLKIIFALMDRGLTGEEIERAMKQVVGPDWKEVQVGTWTSRLQDKHLVREVNEDRFIDELEALILGVIRLEQINRAIT